MLQGGGIRRRIVDGVTMFIVTALSLLLLVYVGFGEGKRTYEQLHVEKVTAQGKIVQNAMETFLRAGLPLKQFAGFTTLAEPIVQSEDVDAIAVYDQAGKQVFIELDKTNPKLPEPSPSIKRVRDRVELDSRDGYYQVILPLRTRFETAGSVVVFSSQRLVDNRLNSGFRILLYLALGLSAAFAILVSVAAQQLARARAPWLQITYAVTFLAMSGFLVATLVTLYSDGVEGKAKSAAATLTQRLHDIVEFNLKFRDIDGLDKMFGDFIRLNHEISEAALIVDGKILIDTIPSRQDRTWTADPRRYEYVDHLSKPDQPRTVDLAVAVPADLVYERVEGSVRNFAALFVASAFLAGLFLQVAASMQRAAIPGLKDASQPPTHAVREESALSIVKPIFFLAVFLENLTYSFLPQYMQGIATTSGLSLGVASLPFTAYYLTFALSLIPAGHLSDRYGPKSLICGGLLISGVGMLCLMLPFGIIAVALIRATAGIGQGILFIGIQAYILAVASPEKKTQGAAIIVFGFQGGMISGMAIGSLLVTYIHSDGVFAISAAIGFAAALYSMLLIPGGAARRSQPSGSGFVVKRAARDLGRVFRSLEFLKAMLLIGVPAKAILTGIITFALPLLLVRQGFRQEEIGQIIMMYGIGVVLTSSYVSRLVDRTGRTELILFWGSMMSGAGLIVVGVTGAGVAAGGPLNTILMVAGVIVVGVAHGFINAPVVTHVAHSRLSAQLGANSVTATYRFLERIGHVAGPMLMGQCFLLWGENLQIIAWCGGIVAIFGVIFMMRPPSSLQPSPPHGSAVGPQVTS